MRSVAFHSVCNNFLGMCMLFALNLVCYGIKIKKKEFCKKCQLFNFEGPWQLVGSQFWFSTERISSGLFKLKFTG